MTIKEVYRNFIEELKMCYDAGEATAITNLVFEHFAKTSTSQIVIEGQNDLTADVFTLLQKALAQLKEHMPVQYITGNAWFYNLSFKVNDSVLIPRPETEELVLEAINFLKNNRDKKVLDIGTGSGCIPISIKKNIPNAQVTSIDVSETALALAKENAAVNNVEINFLQMDFLEEKNHDQFSYFDLIISNPPYIPENEKNILNKNVTDHEPHLALFVPDNNPLIFYKQILFFAETHLEKNGKILMETHENLAKETADIFIAANYEVVIKKDMQGKERMLLINRCQ